MTIISPWENFSRFTHIIQEFRLATVVSVKYGLLGSTFASGGISNDSNIHDVDMYVHLNFDDGRSFLLSWVMRGVDGGLEMILSPVESEVAPGIEVVEVTEMGGWAQLVGHPISEISVLSRLPPGDAQVAGIFAIQIKAARTVAIAIGEVYGGSIRYQPQTIVVKFGSNIDSYIAELEANGDQIFLVDDRS